MKSFDVVVVGSGLAGLNAALRAARWGDVLLVTKARLEDGNTSHAQGGIAAALGSDDSPDSHFQDTMLAGDGLCEPDAVRVLVDEGPSRVKELISLGVPFDRANGKIVVTREAAHSLPRILHAGGDATGARIETTVAQTVRETPGIVVREDCLLADLLVKDGRIAGVVVCDAASGIDEEIMAGAVILATGGTGQLFAHTTNPPVATGDGIAAAYRAGAEMADVEFVQFHPTALLTPGAPRFLISEALRGEGAILRNGAGERFVPRYDPRGELAPRDVVARAIVFEMERTGDSNVFLDATQLGADHVRRRFPTIARVCAEFGIDIGIELIPVAPAAHYFMGGIRTDTWGETSLPGLYACGECACSGVHGANRLASNSLLETLVFSERAVRRHFERSTTEDKGIAERSIAEAASSHLLPPLNMSVGDPRVDRTAGQPTRASFRDAMWRDAGLIRDEHSLAGLASRIDGWLSRVAAPTGRESHELRSMLTVGRLVAYSALQRTESRGAHYRSDYPQAKQAWRRHIVLKNPIPGRNWQRAMSRPGAVVATSTGGSN